MNGRLAGRLAGQVALVTGGGSGVGRAIAIAFAAEGARVVVAGRRAGPLTETVGIVTSAGGEARAVVADVSLEADVARLVAEVEATWQRLDVLVNNAGIYEPATIAGTTPEAWDRTLAVNLCAPFLLARAAFPLLAKDGGGSVINVSSTIGTRPVPGAAAYCVSKAALDMLTRVLAVEWAGSGVRANAIVLGIVDTPIHAARPIADPAEWRRQVDGMHPLGRMGVPEDVVAAAVYLASPGASWTTGAMLAVDGGISLA